MNNTFYNSLDSNLKNQIATTRWYFGDDGTDTNAYTGYNVSTHYNNIRTNTVYGNLYDNYNIGLVYTYDYMYAPLSVNCARTLGENAYSSCLNNNWMKDTTNHNWTINNARRYRNTTNGYYAYNFYINTDGNIYTNYGNSSYAFRPTFHLKNQIYPTRGNGTSSNPYYVAI